MYFFFSVPADSAARASAANAAAAAEAIVNQVEETQQSRNVCFIPSDSSVLPPLILTRGGAEGKGRHGL